MAKRKLPVWETVKRAYSGLGVVFRDLRSYVLIALGLSFLWGLASQAILLDFEPASTVLPLAPEQSFFALVGSAIATVIMTPFGVAMHRRVVLSEVPSIGYFAALASRRSWRFAGMAIALWIVWMGPALVAAGPDNLPLTAIFAVWVLAFPVLMMRVLLLFPAIAVDSPSASLANAWRDTHGMTWRLFFALFIANLPFIIVMMVVSAVRLPAMVPLEEAATVPIWEQAILAVLGILMWVITIKLLCHVYIERAHASKPRGHAPVA